MSCCKHDPETEEKILPEATHEGKNTFGCYVDGEVWRLVEMSMYDVLSVSRNYNMQLKMGVSIENGKGEHANLDIFIDSLGSVGIYPLDDSANYAVWNVIGEYFENEKCCSQIEISFLDTVNNIVSGHFGMTFAEDDGSVVRLSDGRFDVTYKQLVKP